jgi:HEAT repeat protein
MPSMSKNDELDRSRAAEFAWRFTRPGETFVFPEEAQAEAQETADSEDVDGEDVDGEDMDGEDAAPGDESSASHEGFFREARDTCAALAVEIDRLWPLPEAEQAAVLEPLLIRASELGLGLCAMQNYPLHSVRLLRLALRCRDALSDEVWEAAWTSAAWLDYNHPELIELLIEVARAGSRSLVTALMLAVSDGRWKAVARIPGAVARIARVIDDGPGYAARCIAVDWISCIGGREAVPALRRALRAPHFVLRYRALDVFDTRFPDRLQAEDVVFLLRDAVTHAPPDRFHDEENDRANYYLPRMLERAVVRLRPRDAIEPLVNLIEGHCASRWRLGPTLDDAWALGVLAAAFPQEALPYVDHRLYHVSRDRREMATEALSRLPDELARPRLLAAAADGVPEIAERAQAIWLERYAELCPLDPMAGVETALLEGPPSEQMRSRLGVLRSAPIEARAAMVEVLLGEPPDPEGLALLLFAVIDSRLWERRIRPGLPEYRETFCRALIERFGARAVDGLLALEARYPAGRWGWLHALSDLMTRGAIPEVSHPGLRALATRRILRTGTNGDEDESPEYDAISIFAHVGPPPEVADRLWRVACGPSEKTYLQHVSVRALALLPPDEAGLDAVVRAEMEAAMAAPDLPRFALAAAVGFARKLPAAFALTDRALAELGPGRPEDLQVLGALADCVEAIATAGRLPEAFMREALGQPGTYLCAIAARLAQRRKLQEPEAEALAAVFAGDDPTCAAEAACALLGHGTVTPEHPELLGIAARAPLAQRSELLFRMRIRGAPLRDLWPQIEPLLLSADPDVTSPFHHFAYDFGKEGMAEELRVLLPRVVDPELRMDIEELFAREGDGYWEDADDEAD